MVNKKGHVLIRTLEIFNNGYIIILFILVSILTFNDINNTSF